MDGPRYRNLLVPLDGSDFAETALPTAQALAGRFGAELHTLVVDSTDAGDVAAAILRRAADLEDCLVCCASRGRGRVAGAVIGSVARSLLEGTRAPVVVVGPAASGTGAAPLSVPNLVACVDGTPASESVLPDAVAWAGLLRMSLTVLTVAEPTPPPLQPAAPWRRHHGPDEDADEYVARLADKWQGGPVAVTGAVVYDAIGAADGLEIFLAGHPAGLVALTTHARGGLARVVLGAAAAAMVQRATAPALVLPLTGHS